MARVRNVDGDKRAGRFEQTAQIERHLSLHHGGNRAIDSESAQQFAVGVGGFEETARAIVLQHRRK